MYYGNVQQYALCAESFVRNRSLTEREGLSPHTYTYMYHGNVQQNFLCAASCVTTDIFTSSRFSPTIFLSRYKFSTAGRPGSSEVPRNPLTRWDVSSTPANGIFSTLTRLYSSTLYAQNPVCQTVHLQSVKVYLYVQRECTAEPTINAASRFRTSSLIQRKFVSICSTGLNSSTLRVSRVLVCNSS